MARLCDISPRILPASRTAGALSPFSEIIAWKLRLFVPVGAAGPEILARLLERYPLTKILDRNAA